MHGDRLNQVSNELSCALPTHNRPFPSCFQPFTWKWVQVHSIANKIHFHVQGFALGLALKKAEGNLKMAYCVSYPFKFLIPKCRQKAVVGQPFMARDSRFASPGASGERRRTRRKTRSSPLCALGSDRTFQDSSEHWRRCQDWSRWLKQQTLEINCRGGGEGGGERGGVVSVVLAV